MRLLRVLVPVALVGACAADEHAVPPVVGGGPVDPSEYGTEVMQGYHRVRAATDRFHVLDSAIAAGYAPQVAKCYTDTVHAHGAMGYHHVNRTYMDSIVDIEKPEILMYERRPDSSYALTGVEYILPYQYWPGDSVPPTLMGRELFREDERQYWYAHMWVWTENPKGLFADWNPEVACRGT